MKKELNIYDPGLAGIIVRFAIFLKAHGFRVFQSSIHDALLSLGHVNIFNKQDLFFTLRANLVNSDMEWSRFPPLFNEFWDMYMRRKKGGSGRAKSRQLAFIENLSNGSLNKKEDKETKTSSNFPVEAEKQYIEGIGYSPISRVEKRDISLLNDADIQIAKLALKKIAEPFKIQKTRRTKRRQQSGYCIDFPSMIRKSLKFEGYPLELFFKEKKKRLRKLVIIADVSGSMERYASFVIPFILSIRGAGSKAEVFVFSTSLTRVTHIIRHLDLKKTLSRIAEEVPNWAGGTRIGFSLKQFNQWYGRDLANKRAVIIILSDGWDLGSKELLRKEMEDLNKKVYSIIWLNPILNDPNLNRMCKGMQVSLPYIDHLVPVNSLEGLKRVGRLISRLMVH
ncbi:MAG: hypothetical protein DRG39_06465 [Deltaproteobacteria bacterium]|nr:MAG: hypothetical protein DRG39_06465 [Deltaproteobacteria bacterium]